MVDKHRNSNNMPQTVDDIIEEGSAPFKKQCKFIIKNIKTEDIGKLLEIIEASKEDRLLPSPAGYYDVKLSSLYEKYQKPSLKEMHIAGFMGAKILKLRRSLSSDAKNTGDELSNFITFLHLQKEALEQTQKAILESILASEVDENNQAINKLVPADTELTNEDQEEGKTEDGEDVVGSSDENLLVIHGLEERETKASVIEESAGEEVLEQEGEEQEEKEGGEESMVLPAPQGNTELTSSEKSQSLVANKESKNDPENNKNLEKFEKKEQEANKEKKEEELLESEKFAEVIKGLTTNLMSIIESDDLFSDETTRSLQKFFKGLDQYLPKGKDFMEESLEKVFIKRDMKGEEDLLSLFRKSIHLSRNKENIATQKRHEKNIQRITNRIFLLFTSELMIQRGRDSELLKDLLKKKESEFDKMLKQNAKTLHSLNEEKRRAQKRIKELLDQQQQYNEDLKNLEQVHGAEINTLLQAHENELSELNEEIKDLEKKEAELTIMQDLNECILSKFTECMDEIVDWRWDNNKKSSDTGDLSIVSGGLANIFDDDPAFLEKKGWLSEESSDIIFNKINDLDSSLRDFHMSAESEKELQETVGEMERTLNFLREENSNLEQELEVADNDILALHENEVRLQTQISEKYEEIVGLKEEKIALEEEKIDLEKSLKKSEKAKGKMEKKIERQAANITNLLENNQDWKQKVQKNNDKIYELNSKITGLETQITAAEEAYEKLEKEQAESKALIEKYHEIQECADKVFENIKQWQDNDEQGEDHGNTDEVRNPFSDIEMNTFSWMKNARALLSPDSTETVGFSRENSVLLTRYTQGLQEELQFNYDAVYLLKLEQAENKAWEVEVNTNGVEITKLKTQVASLEVSLKKEQDRVGDLSRASTTQLQVIKDLEVEKTKLENALGKLEKIQEAYSLAVTAVKEYQEKGLSDNVEKTAAKDLIKELMSFEEDIIYKNSLDKEITISMNQSKALTSFMEEIKKRKKSQKELKETKIKLDKKEGENEGLEKTLKETREKGEESINGLMEVFSKQNDAHSVIVNTIMSKEEGDRSNPLSKLEGFAKESDLDVCITKFLAFYTSDIGSLDSSLAGLDKTFKKLSKHVNDINTISGRNKNNVLEGAKQQFQEWIQGVVNDIKAQIEKQGREAERQRAEAAEEKIVEMEAEKAKIDAALLKVYKNMQETLAMGNNVLSVLGGNPNIAANNDLWGSEPRQVSNGGAWSFAGTVVDKLSGGAGKAVDKISGGAGNVVNMIGSGADKLRKERHEAKLARIERNPGEVKASIRKKFVNFMGGEYEDSVEGLSDEAKKKIEFDKNIKKSTNLKNTLGSKIIENKDYLKIFQLEGSDVQVKKIKNQKVTTEYGKYDIPDGIQLEQLKKALVIADDLDHKNSPVTLKKNGECMVEKGGSNYFIKPNGEVYSDYDIYQFVPDEGLKLRDECQASLDELNEAVGGETLDEDSVTFNGSGEITEVHIAITLYNKLPSSITIIKELHLPADSSSDKKFMKSLKGVEIQKLYYGSAEVK